MINELIHIEKIIKGNKFSKFLNFPFRYVFNILYRKLIYPLSKKGILLSSKTFFSSTMFLNFPSGADIYIFGSKSHDSEIRLSKFMIHHLTEGDLYADVGAHFGFYSLLASKLVSEKGSVYSFEASKKTFNLLEKNCGKINNINIFNNACIDRNEIVHFYEFPTYFSEYNSIDSKQYENEKWFQKNKPLKISIQGIILDESLPFVEFKMIKIDVEGAELKVVSGLSNFLESNKVKFISLEYINDKREVSNHKKASQYLIENNYLPYFINKKGKTEPIMNLDIVSYMAQNKLDSDNIIFQRRN